MKKRVIALLLCVVMLATTMGAGVFMPPDIKIIDADANEAVSAVAVPQSERVKLTTDYQSSNELGFQWQLSADGKAWVNIYGQTGSSILLSYAMVCNMLSEDGTAQVRCIVTDGDSEYESRAAEVSIDYSAPARIAKAPARAAAVQNDAAPADASDAESGQRVFVIKYIFEDGTQAANDWTATVPENDTTYTATVTSPTVVGYTPDQAVVDVNNSQTEYTVTYYPAEVNYTVNHYQQNIDNDNYTLTDTETKTGRTKSQVGDNLQKTYEGFTALLYDTTTEIAADGSTVIEIYYDRNYYLLSLDLDGGYGAEPMYARYGTTISIANPTKAGYTFGGWKPDMPTTMPAENRTLKAQWNPGTSGFTVVFWYENADDNGYSVAGTYKPADVAPGTTVKSGDYKNQNFTGRDTSHFTYNAAKAETVTVSGDGSTVLNVYFTRNTYTLTFTDGTERVLTCGMEAHKHTSDGWYLTISGVYYYGGCYPPGSYDGIGTGTGGAKNPTCGKEEHTHRSSCYSNQPKVVKTITAKYGADIHENFPIKDGNETIWWKVPDNTETYGKLDQQRYLGSIDTMLGENITFTKNDSESGAVIYYYVETINGENGDVSYKGKNYKLYKKIDLDYNSGVSLTYREEFHPITGFTQGESNPYLPVDGSVRMQKSNYLYYTRNSYSLKFYNYNAYVDGKGGSVQYEAPLSGYYFTPDYPENLEKGAYVFDGWYTTAGGYAGSEANLETMTMPASDVILYAKWAPVTHTVKTWLTNDMKTPVNVGGSNEQSVQHRQLAVKPDDPTNGQYVFVGWFYMDNGVEKAFDFSMPVTKDLDLYAKWSSNTPVEYTIKYTLEDGTEIAPPTTGSALAGATKTFDAKAGTALNEGYQSGYFPKTNSHSLTMNIEGGNEFTFVYVAKPEVSYTVRYLEKGTNTVLHEEKHAATRDAVITEKFELVSGYAPDAYQKKLVLSAEDSENVLTFWYTKDDVHAPVQIIHWKQNIAGDDYTEYRSSTDLNGVIGETYTEAPLDLAGFKYDEGKSESSGTLTVEGLVLNLYYDRIEYPYEFRFLEQGTDKELAASITGNARYQAQVTARAKTIPGYKLVSAGNQAITIAIEDPADTASKNVKTFYYTEETVDINYKVVGPVDCGTLTQYSENVKAVTGNPVGSTASTANDTYKFVGWYLDEACTKPVDTDWVNGTTILPQKTKDYDNNTKGYESATYYAKFELNLTSMTLKKVADPYDANDMFIFTVTDSKGNVFAKVALKAGEEVKLDGLTIGEKYFISEDNNWSWRYANQDPKEITINSAESKNVVNVTNTVENNKWLGASSYAINKCLDTVSSQISAFFAKLFN